MAFFRTTSGTPGRIHRAIAAAGVATVAGTTFALAGCSPGEAHTPAPAPPATSTATPHPTETATPTPVPTKKPAPKPKPKTIPWPKDAREAGRHHDTLTHVKVVHRETVRPGIQYVRVTARSKFGPEVLHLTVSDIRRPDLAVRVSRPNERGETTSKFAHRTNAYVTTNGGAWEVHPPWTWNEFQPRGLTIGDGRVWPKTVDTQKDTFIACDQNDVCTMDGPWTAVKKPDPRWRNVINGWGSPLIYDGKPNFNYAHQEALAHVDGPNPRTVVALTQSGKMVNLVIDGRSSKSAGVSYAQVVNFLTHFELFKNDKVVNAAMVDGGGSSAFVKQGHVMNHPSDDVDGHTAGAERVVADAIAIILAKTR